MFFLVEAFLLLSYTGMVYVLSCRGFLDVMVYTGMVYVLSCRGFLFVIVHRDSVCSSVEAFLMLSYTGMVYVLSFRGFS